jgi:glycosyltransferase, group 1 family protein
MKILHLGQLIGGLDIYIRNTIAYADSSFYFVIAHGKADNSKSVMRMGKPVKEYKINLYRSLNLWNDIIGLVQTIWIIHKEKPDIIHCHSAKGGFIGRVAGFLTRTKTFYTPHAFSFLSSSSVLKRKIFIFLERIVRTNSYLLACSESERALGIEFVHYNEKKAKVWHNSVPDASVSYSDVEIKNIPFISCIGRPCYQKNPLFLLDVIRRVAIKMPQLKFYLLGVGFYSPDLTKMKEQITEWHLEENIVLLPWISHEECLEYVQHSLFYLSVSLYEGLPLSIIEAMSLGKAIIASDVIGNRDCVKHKINGYLLPLDKDIFYEKIIEISNNHSKRVEFGKKSRELYLSDFYINNQIQNLLKIYREA